MSTQDEQEKDVSAAAAGDGEAPPPATEGKKGSANSAPFVILFFIVGFIASLLVGWIVFPQLLYSEKKQPIDFNHALHGELVDSSCESCHFFREDGSFSGVPTLAQCIDCHEDVQGESPEEEKFVTEYVQKEREVPWLIYSRQPDCVFFSHIAHVGLAGNDCVTCHGEIGESEHLRVYEENRITGYSRDIWGRNISGIKRNTWDRMKMDDCAECHAAARDAATVKKIRKPLGRVIDNLLAVAFPGMTVNTRGSSVQTVRGACFECHK
jgi:menaquinone reductase, multiheme cytochrome c subunit